MHWLGNAALAYLVWSALKPGVLVIDGLSLVALGLVLGMDVSRGSRERWS